MALQSSGQISLDNVQTEFGGTNPINIDEYYRGGSLVPNTPANSNIPTSGTIAMDDFYGGTASSTPTYNVSVNNTSINEGNATTVTVTTANVPNGTELYYRVSGTVENYFVGVSSASSAQVGTALTEVSPTCTRCTDAAVYNYFWTPAVYAAWDVDGDGIVSAEDSIRVVRWMINSSSTSLDADDLRLPSNATRLTNSQMMSHITSNSPNGYYDLDGDGSVGLFSDGITGIRINGGGIQTSGQNIYLNPQDDTPAEFFSDFEADTWAVGDNTSQGPSYQGRIEIQSNTGSKVFTASSDSITENSETFTVAISAAPNVSTALTTTQTVTITNTSSGISSDAAYYTPGSYVFTVPDDTEVISAVAIGGGGGGSTSTLSANGISGGGGGGGALHYNTFEVTPGEELAIVVGPGGSGGSSAGNNNANAGGESSIKRGATYLVRAGGGSAGLYNVTTGYTPGGTNYSGTYGGGGGNGGRGGCGSNGNTGGGGGGAGGYSGNGGDGSQGTSYNETAGSGGGGGGGTGANAWVTAVTWGGGGVEALGEGPSGGANATTNNIQGEPGSNGTAQSYGGGGSGAEDDSGAAGAPGAGGAVRLIWGANRSYPSTNTLGPATYSFTTTPATVTEGNLATFVLGTTNVLNGTTLYWTILHGTTSASDFPSTSGSFATTTNSTSIDISTTLDSLLSETTETFQLQIRTGSTSGTVVATSSSVSLINKAGLSAGEFEFKYYAYGSTIGTLSLYWETGGTAYGPIQMVANGVTVNSIQGQQQNGTGQAWRTATADFSAHSGTTGRPVFRYITGTSYTGDIQLDKIKLGNTSGEIDLDPDLKRSPGTDNWQQGKGSTVYSNITFADCLVTTSATSFWNYDAGGTPSSSTGNTVDADGSSTSYYLYAETSSPNYSTIYGWLRTKNTYSI